MSLKFDNKDVSFIKYKDSTKKRSTFKDVNILKYKESEDAEPEIVWVKVFKLIYSYNDYLLKSPTVTRIFSNNPDADLGKLYSGRAIYYDDILTFDIELKDEYVDTYEIDQYDTEIRVNDDYNFYFSAHLKDNNSSGSK